jgi:hypothetical protein
MESVPCSVGAIYSMPTRPHLDQNLNIWLGISASHAYTQHISQRCRKILIIAPHNLNLDASIIALQILPSTSEFTSLDHILFFEMRISTGFCIILSFSGMLFVGGTDTNSTNVWAIDHDNPAICHERHICTPSHRRWLTNSTLYFEKDACEVLTKKGIKRIIMMGDSFMRHMYEALIMTVTGNYRDSPLIRSDKSCEYHMLFCEKRCSTTMLLGEKLICDDKISVHASIFSYSLPGPRTAGDLIFFSEGNHARNGDMRVANNFTAYKDHFLYGDSLCSMAGPPSITTWVSTHARMAPTHEFETSERVRNFNDGMKDFILSGRCGPIDYIDVYNMTNELISHHEADAAYMTFDKAHWGMEVNLVKIQILLAQVNDNPNITFVH